MTIVNPSDLRKRETNQTHGIKLDTKKAPVHFEPDNRKTKRAHGARVRHAVRSQLKKEAKRRAFTPDEPSAVLQGFSRT